MNAPSVGASRRVVLTSDTAAREVDRFTRLRESGFDLVLRFDLAEVADSAVLVDALAGAWAVVASSANRLDRHVIESLPHLRVIGRTGVGFDAVDVQAATDNGILVFTTPGTFTETVADFTLALMLACLRDVLVLDAALRNGHWRPIPMGRDLHGATVVIVGFGAIGQAVARRLSGFSCRVIVVDPAADPSVCAKLGVEMSVLEDALPIADVVTVHVPLMRSTRALLGRREISSLRRSAIIVNTSRGAVVDEAALVDALNTGQLAGAALDVFDQEPLSPQHPLTTFRNVVLSPHAASSSQAAVARTCDAVVDGLLAVAAGALPAGCLNPEVIATAARS